MALPGRLLRLVLAPALLVVLGAAAPAPKLAVMIAGIGYAKEPDLAAIALPPAVGLALSPYGAHIRSMASAAAKAGHELLMGLPMEPNGAPASNEGPQALDPDGSDTDNSRNLDWALAQATGYDGTTDAIGTANGGAFMARGSARSWLTQALSKRHLFFIDAKPGLAPRVLPGRAATVMIDPDQGPDATRQALKQLVADDRASGSALAVVLEPAPKTVAILASWLRTLDASGIILVPVRDVVTRP